MDLKTPEQVVATATAVTSTERRVLPVATWSPHPLAPALGRTVVHDVFLPDESIERYLKRVGLFERIGRVPVLLSLNGYRIPRALWSRVYPHEGTVLHIQAVVQGSDQDQKTLRTVALIALMAASPMFVPAGTGMFTAGLIKGAVIVIGGIIINKVFPLPQTLMSDTQGPKDSPTYSLSGGSNRARPYEPMPLILGAHKVFPDVSAKAYTEFEGEDQFYYEAFDFGYNDVLLTDFKIGQTPIGTFENVQLELSGQDGRLQLMPLAVDSIAGGNVTFAGGPIIRTSSLDVTGLAVDIVATLFYSGDGGIVSRSVQLRLEYRKVGDIPWLPFMYSTATTTFTNYWSAGYWIWQQGVGQIPDGPKWVQVDIGTTVFADHTDGQFHSKFGDWRNGFTTITWRWRPYSEILNGSQLIEPSPPRIVYTQTDLVTLVHSLRSPLRRTFKIEVPKAQYEIRVQRVTADETDPRAVSEVAWTVLKSYRRDETDYLGRRRAAIKVRASGQLEGRVEQLSAVASAKVPIRLLVQALKFSAGSYAKSVGASLKTLTGNFTLAAWIRMDVAPVGPTRYAIVSNRVSLASGLRWWIEGSTGKQRIETNQVGASTSGEATTPVVLSQVVHLAVVRSGTTVTFYRNGLPDGTATGINSAVAATRDFHIAIESDAVADPFNGAIDGMYVYSKALTAREVKDLYGTIEASDPIAVWQFDEGTGSLTNDSSINNNSATLTGSPLWVTGLSKSYTVQETSNPGRLFLAVARGRFVNGRRVWGAGLPDSRIDLESIEAFTGWCTTKGLTFNGVFDQHISAYEMLSAIALRGRGTVSWGSGKLGVVYDQDSLPAVAVFSMANIREGSFAIEYATERLADELVANFINPSIDWQRDTVRVLAPGVTTPAFSKPIELFGCTSVVEAAKTANLYLATNLHRYRRYKWQMDAEGLPLQRGEVGYLSHDLASYDYSGRLIEGSTAAVLKLPRKVPLQPTGSFVTVVKPDASFSTHAVQAGSGDSDTLTLTASLPYNPGADPTHPPYDYRWLYGPTSTPGRKVKIDSIRPISENAIELTAIDETTSYYASETNPYEHLPPTPVFGTPVISNLQITEEAVVAGTGYMAEAVVTWQASGDYGLAEVRASIDGGTLQLKGETTSRMLRFPLSDGVALVVELTAYSSLSRLGASAKLTASKTLGLLNSILPPTVASLTATLEEFGVRLTWPTISHVRSAAYEIRLGVDYATAAFVAKVDAGSHLVKVQVVGSYTFGIKALDSKGNYSSTPTYTSPTVISAPQIQNLAATAIGEQMNLTWTPQLGSWPIDRYRVYYGDTFPGGATLLDTRYTSSFSTKALWLSRKFWVEPVDVAGNVGTAVSVTHTVTVPGTPAVSSSILNAAATLSWTHVPQTLPIDRYEIRQGVSFSAGTPVASLRSLTYTLNVDWFGPRTFWVVGVDTAENFGVAGSVAVNISAPAAPTVQQNIVSNNYVLTWSAPSSVLPIVEYEIRYGASFGVGTLVGRTKGTTTSRTVDWLGDRTFWVAAIDSNGNVGAAGSTVISVSVPAAPTMGASIVGPNYFLNWSVPNSSLSIAEYEVRHGVSWAAGTSLGKLKATATLGTRVTWLGERFFWIAAIDVNGNVGAIGSVSLTVIKPSTPIVSIQVIDNNVLLSWSEGVQTLPVTSYEVRRGTTFSTAEVIGRISARFSVVFESTPGTYSYWVVGFDSADNQGTEGVVSAVVAQPPDFVFYDSQVSQLDSASSVRNLRQLGSQYVLSLNGSTQWGEVASVPPLDSGITGLTFEAWVLPNNLSSNTDGLIEKTIGGTVNTCANMFLSSGNATMRVLIGAVQKDATISLSSFQTKQPIHLIGRWDGTNVKIAAQGGAVTATTLATGSLDQGAGKLLVGSLSGTSRTNGALGPCRIYKRAITDVEVGEHYRDIYKSETNLMAVWDFDEGSGLVSYDDSDNAFDLALQTSPAWTLHPLDGRRDLTAGAPKLYYPVNVTETFAEHFTNNAATTHQDLITAGYTHGLAPAPNNAQYVEVVDLGVTLASSRITVSLASQPLLGTVTITPTISVRKLATDAWTDFAGVFTVYAADFRYVKITIAVTSAGGNHLGYASSLTLLLNSKQITDSGVVSALSTDTTGTQVNFSLTFYDVTAINVSPKGTAELKAVYDFVDTPNPTGFKVYLFNAAGARASGDVSWTARGV